MKNQADKHPAVPSPAAGQRTAPAAGKHYSEMTAAELAAATRHLEHVRFEDTKPLTRAEQARFERSRATGRGLGRPGKPKDEAAQRVSVSIEPKLLKLADASAMAFHQSLL